ncbi:hypothetical protein [Actinopolymorpha cephalotaxi]|uniref:hypothetical protein n=1 Tax=Actinopolymorpha cephalotaxi TaxID=504797 RepID=UPI003644EAFD
MLNALRSLAGSAGAAYDGLRTTEHHRAEQQRRERRGEPPWPRPVRLARWA